MADWLCSNIVPGGCVSSVIVGCFREPELPEVVLNYGTSLQLVNINSRGDSACIFQQPLFSTAKDMRCLPSLRRPSKAQVGCKANLSPIRCHAAHVLIGIFFPSGSHIGPCSSTV